VPAQTQSGGQGQRRWFRGDDDELRARLGAELERLGGADPFQALGVGHDADAAAVRAAFLAVTKEYHPSRFARRDRDIVRQANEVFLRLKAAYDHLRTDEGRARARERHAGGSGEVRARAATVPGTPGARTEREPPAAPTPGAATGKGRRRHRDRTARGSEPPPARASGQIKAPTVVEQVLERNKRDQAQFDEARALCDAGRWAEARRIFHQLAVDNSHVKRYRVHMHHAWGREHQQAGRLEEARAEFRRALDIDPEFDAAQAALTDLPEPKDKARGLFSRLFRK
jgi:tetratricopeptide (TPR) repeat protein